MNINIFVKGDFTVTDSELDLNQMLGQLASLKDVKVV